MNNRPLLLAGQRVEGYPAFPRVDGRKLITGTVTADMTSAFVECVRIEDDETGQQVTILYPPIVVLPTVPTWRKAGGPITGLLVALAVIEVVLWWLR